MVCSLKLKLSFFIISIATGTKTLLFSPYYFSFTDGMKDFEARLFPIGGEEGGQRKYAALGFSVIRGAVLGMHILRGNKFSKVRMDVEWWSRQKAGKSKKGFQISSTYV